MFNKLKDFFSGGANLEVDQSGQASNEELQIATAVLLLEMAGADDDFAPEEIQACFRTMEKQFGIEDTNTLEIMEKAQTLRDERGKIDTFVKAINDNFSDKQKQLILAMIWKVIIADELIEKYEQRFAEQLRNRLQLSNEQSEEAKTLALEGRV